MSNLLELAEKARIQRELEKQGKRALETLQAKRKIENYINEQKQILQDQLKKERQSFQGNLQKEKQAHQEELKSLQERIESSRKDFGQEIRNPILGASGVYSGDGDRIGLFDMGNEKPIRENVELEAVGRAIQGSKQGDGHSKLQDARQDAQAMRKDRPELSRPRMGGQYENNNEKGGIDGPSYEALKGSIARFRREAGQRVEAIKREIKQAAELYRKIAGRKPDIAELAREIIGKFKLKLQKQVHEKKENKRSCYPRQGL